MTLVPFLELASALAALTSAWFWGLSARRTFVISEKLDNRIGEDGDMAFDFGDGKFHVERNGRSSRLNAWAASFAALAATLQAAAALASM